MVALGAMDWSATRTWILWYCCLLFTVSCIATTPMYPTPELVWELDLGVDVESGIVEHNSVLYVSCTDGSVRALAVDLPTDVRIGLPSMRSLPIRGEILWTHETGALTLNSKPLVHNDIVYVGTYNNRLVTLDPLTGNTLWQFNTTSEIAYSSPLVDDDSVYFGTLDGTVYSLSLSTKNSTWEYTMPGAVVSTPVISDRYVIFTSKDGTVTALYVSSGHEKWSYTAPGGISSSPIIIDSYLYFGSLDGSFISLKVTTGHEHWKISTLSKIYATAVYDPKYDGVVFGSGEDVYYVDKGNGEIMWKVDTSNIVSDAPLIVDDSVIVPGAASSVIYLSNGTLTNAVGVDVATTPVSLNDFVFLEEGKGVIRGYRGRADRNCSRSEGWAETMPGKIAKISCGGGFVGQIFRGCSLDAEWGTADRSECERLICLDGTSTIPSGDSQIMDCDVGFKGTMAKQCTLDGELVIIEKCEPLYCNATADGFPRARAGTNVSLPCGVLEAGSIERHCNAQGGFDDPYNACVPDSSQRCALVAADFLTIIGHQSWWMYVIGSGGAMVVVLAIMAVRLRARREKKNQLLKDANDVSDAVARIEGRMMNLSSSVTNLKKNASDLHQTAGFYAGDAATPRSMSPASSPVQSGGGGGVGGNVPMGSKKKKRDGDSGNDSPTPSPSSPRLSSKASPISGGSSKKSETSSPSLRR